MNETLKCLIFDKDEETCQTIQEVIFSIRQLEFAKSCQTQEELIQALSKDEIGILFIDISILDKDGIQHLRNIANNGLKLIVLGSNREEAAEAYELDAVDFILKPIRKNLLIKSLTKIVMHNVQFYHDFISKNNSLFVKDKGRLIRIYLYDILLIEALADYMTIYTSGKKYIIHSTMKKVEANLPTLHFVRVHKSFIVNIDKISEIKNEVVIIDKRSVPIGQSYKKELYKKLNIL